MKRTVSIVMALAFIIVFAHGVFAQMDTKPGGFVVDAVTATATVKAINAEKLIKEYSRKHHRGQSRHTQQETGYIAAFTTL